MTKVNKKITIHSLTQMQTFAHDIMQQGYKRILLSGSLGSGKTTFSKAFVKALGYAEDLVKSPTFTYYNVYEGQIFHGDFYRLESRQAFISKGIFDKVDAFPYTLIERPKFEELYVDSDWIHLSIEVVNDTRIITVHTI